MFSFSSPPENVIGRLSTNRTFTSYSGGRGRWMVPSLSVTCSFRDPERQQHGCGGVVPSLCRLDASRSEACIQKERSQPHNIRLMPGLPASQFGYAALGPGRRLRAVLRTEQGAVSPAVPEQARGNIGWASGKELRYKVQTELRQPDRLCAISSTMQYCYSHYIL